MSEAWLGAARWLLHAALGGGLLLLLTWLAVRRVRQPARQQRLAEWGTVASLVLAVLCLAPSWLVIPLPMKPAEDITPVAEARQEPQTRDEKVVPDAEVPPPAGPDWLAVAGDQPAPAEAVQPPAASPAPPQIHEETQETEKVAGSPRLTPETLLAALVCLYFAGAVWFLARLVLGYRRLARVLAVAEEAPEEVRRLFEEMVPSSWRPRLLVSHLVRVPLSCGVLRPTVLLPASLCHGDAGPRLRWVLAHELAHIRRRDAVVCLLFGVAQVVYYFVPWLWWLRRQVRLCQEHVADAAAVVESGPPEDYAEFLLAWSAAPALPAGATGVSGHTSDLFRRITMLVKSPIPIEERCPRRLSLLAGVCLLSLAIVGAGIGLRAVAAPAPAPKDDKKDEVKKDKDVTKDKKDADKKDKDDPPADKKDPDKKDRPRQPDLLPDIDELMKRLPANMPEEQRKLMRQQMEQMRKMMEQMRKQMPGGGFPGGLPGLPGGVVPAFPQFPQFPGGNGFNPFGRQQEPRLGVRLDRPSDTLVDQLDLPKGQGLIVEEVMGDSAAAKAGLKKHDILLELDGKPVPNNVQEFARIVKEIKPDTKVDAVVLRKTRKEAVKGITLPKAKEAPQPGNFGGFGGRFGNAGVFGGF
ncbi:MAG TPA: M56 family metallopeptidase, partial [Gemmataceae bacterium]|nr:M56 family metallopeptidase [Gemmataceae bacterium]